MRRCQKQLQGQMRTMLAARQDRTQYRPTSDSSLMKWIVRHAGWFIPRFRGTCNGVARYRGKALEFGESVLAHLPEVGKGIWESRAEVEIRRVAGHERPHRRASGQDRWRSLLTREVRDDSPSHSGSEENLSSSCRNTIRTQSR